MTDTKEQEVFRIYQKYPWIEVSNLGRVRTKDRIVTRSDGMKLYIKGKGCWLTYADENVIENVREKFGDEMANKVKKLMKKKTERVIV